MPRSLRQLPSRGLSIEPVKAPHAALLGSPNEPYLRGQRRLLERHLRLLVKPPAPRLETTALDGVLGLLVLEVEEELIVLNRQRAPTRTGVLEAQDDTLGNSLPTRKEADVLEGHIDLE